MEAGADLEEGGDSAPIGDMTSAGGGDMAEEFQKGALAGTILADDADDIALLYLEGDIFQCPDIVGGAFLTAVVDFAYLEVGVFLTEDAGLPPAVDVVLEAAGADKAKAVLLADAIKLYCNVFIHNYYLTGTLTGTIN